MNNITSRISRRYIFYKDTVKAFIKDKKASVLVIAGDSCDRDIFLQLGFMNVIISNLDSRIERGKFSPYKWNSQDAHKLAYEDNSFDYAVVHEGLHHCSSQHSALLEMYRIAKKGVIAIEARDNFIIRLLRKIRLTQTYETAAVYYNNSRFGGVNNTDIPNYIYRWTENEVEKTISSFAPYAKHDIKYRYGFDWPCTPKLEKNRLKNTLKTAFIPIFVLFSLLFPKQQNLFAFFIKKPIIPKDLFPWVAMDKDKLSFNKEWAAAVYKQ